MKSFIFYAKFVIQVLAAFECITGLYTFISRSIIISEISQNFQLSQPSQQPIENIMVTMYNNQTPTTKTITSSLNNTYSIDGVTASITLLISSFELIFSILQMYFGVALLNAVFKMLPSQIESCLKYFIFHVIVTSILLIFRILLKLSSQENHDGLLVIILPGIFGTVLHSLLISSTLYFLTVYNFAK